MKPFRMLPQAPASLPPRKPAPLPKEAIPPRRRDLLGALSAAAVAPAVAVAAPAPDVVLITECARAMEAQRECEASYCYPLHLTAEEAKPYEDRADHFADLAFTHAENALDLPANTLAGAAAKARAALALAAKRSDGSLITNGTPDDLAWSALGDLLRLLKMAEGGG
ncbi:hypothetical protein [Muricoccus pecuniae]|uniref:Carboxylesterase type B n=1 Tax=Muricoccus pecuniae TaxID=693023 RepID=A0A840Y461_9PROT|nr:hypothetical protein [Roseomonas pecuniae]MBB5695515.1 carboxylesterase type B [Roseomonas pecuniae]